MNYVDIALLAIIGIYAIIGFYKGALKSIVSLLGSILILLLAFYLKDPVANYLINDLPFIKLGGAFSGISAINLLVYKVIAFVTIYAILKLLLLLILKATNIIDKIIKKTVIFELPSKIIGLIIGLIEGVVVVFIISFLMMQFGPTQKYAINSKVATKIVDKTPFMSKMFKKTIQGTKDIYKIIEDTGKKAEKNEKIVEALVESGIFSKEDMQKIINSGKMEESND